MKEMIGNGKRGMHSMPKAGVQSGVSSSMAGPAANRPYGDGEAVSMKGAGAGYMIEAKKHTSGKVTTSAGTFELDGGTK